MSSEFSMVSLEQVSSKIGDGIHGTPKYDEKGSYYFINGNNLNSGRVMITTSTKKVSYEQYVKHKKELNSTTVLLSINGTIGNVAIYNHEPIILGKSACYINVHTNVNVNYIGYVLKDKKFQNYIKQQANGSTIKNVSLKLVREFKFPLPPKLQQDQIAGILCSLDKKITINKDISQTLEQIAQALFKSWFVDFEPVKAKIAILEAGGSQEEATLAAMAAISGKDADSLAIFEQEHPEKYAELRATAKLFPSVMQESELGIIPEQWHVESIKSLTLILSKGTTPAKKDIILDEPQVINFLKVKDISNNGEINSSGLDKVSKRVHENLLKRSILKENDLLFSIAGTIGRVSVVTADILDCNCNQAIAFVRLEQPSSHLHLVRMNLLSSRIQQEVESKLVQGVQANLSLTSLGDLKIILPSNDILNVFNGIIAPIWEEQHSINRQSNYLSQLRDTLLPKLLSGEITLPEAEELAKEADYV
ncbi:restriction endonuclease subunit S [Escherichia coli]|uniref:restriction endonuclease subunit S n=1 Tax=Escherichia coli TaxID=562 RepID=UPI000FBF338A|nr:restriction endonuclease subunit S [Escherichia coli]EEV6062117.1 restriction endonuclease subunit S [Escherichia coli]EEW2109983.1 restriction endonuclease subunit S [Escherichia coli]EFH6268146.1 restriction endonuclease subunit S [Escherichia coli]EIN2034868.1 restriction endonuclease subunit S [Escherichia coli]EIW6380640.1 restriction endonuclease subunit S [Escherichia coli]